jgi:phosphatidate cytidylyltransferase
MLIAKSCDIGAYFAGRHLGRHKLIPWLSPAKTWEGLIGGMLLSGLLAAGLTWVGAGLGLLGSILGPETDPSLVGLLAAALAGALIGLAGQGGDLVASMLKRDAGFKDFSQTMPGFGGMLDVIDSLLLTAPVGYGLLLIARV